MQPRILSAKFRKKWIREKMSDIKILEIPKWGLSMEEGTLVGWHISEGDSFSEGDELCDIETSKITNVYEAPFSGVLRKILADIGETLPVKAPIALVADASITEDDIDTFAANLSSKTGVKPVDNNVEVSTPNQVPEDNSVTETKDTPTALGAKTNIPAILQNGGDDTKVLATLHGRKFAKNLGVNLKNVSGSGRRGRISKKDVIVAIEENGGNIGAALEVAIQGGTKTTEVKATPLAKRVASNLGVDIRDCIASNPQGRIDKAAVIRAHKSGAKTITALPSIIVEMSTGAGSALSPMRKTIAARLQQSKQQAPHFRLVVDCEIDKLLATRKLINDNFSSVKITVNDLLVKACAEALVQNPDCNVQFDGQTLYRFEDVDITIAVALEGGLITPKITNANKKGLSTISREAADLIERAKAGRLTPDEYQGGTFTISNLGMFGVKNFDAIINPPQCAILAVGAGEKRNIVKDDVSVIATIMTLTLSSDHRVIDGATAAKFMQTLKGLIENPALLAL